MTDDLIKEIMGLLGRCAMGGEMSINVQADTS
jgi:hypothetical protein